MLTSAATDWLHGIMDRDLLQWGEIGNAGYERSTDDGQLSQIDMHTATQRGHSQQLSAVGPLDAVNLSHIIERHNVVHLVQVLQVMNLHAGNELNTTRKQ